MLVIRFSRRGKKHQPSFRIMVAEKRSKLTGESIEDLGSYNASTKKATLNKERISHWLKVGAKATPTVHNLLIKEKVFSGAKMPIKMKAKKAETATA